MGFQVLHLIGERPDPDSPVTASQAPTNSTEHPLRRAISMARSSTPNSGEAAAYPADLRSRSHSLKKESNICQIGQQLQHSYYSSPKT